jgi:hypothetical protein
MRTFYEYLADLALLSRLTEAYFTFDPQAYRQLFEDELEKVIQRADPAHRQSLEQLRGLDWVGYIAKGLRNAGFRDQREVQERTHDIVVKLLTGTLFRGYDVRGGDDGEAYLLKRFARAVANGIRNMVEKERNRRRLLPTVSIGQDYRPGDDDLPDRTSADDDEGLIDDFRRLVGQRLGKLGCAVLDARMAGDEMKSLVGRPSLGSPGRFVVKQVVQQIKELAREFAQRHGDPAFTREIDRAMEREGATVQKRLATGAARQSPSLV